MSNYSTDLYDSGLTFWLASQLIHFFLHFLSFFPFIFVHLHDQTKRI